MKIFLFQIWQECLRNLEELSTKTLHFKPNNILRQSLVRPKDKTPAHERCSVLYAVQCNEEHTEETNKTTTSEEHGANTEEPSPLVKSQLFYIYLNNE